MKLIRNVCSAVIMITCSNLAFAADPAFPLTAKRVLFLGDSITHAGHYISLIEANRQLAGEGVPELINLGLPSETCSGLSEPEHPFPRPNVHERIGRALDKLKPDVVVACYGMNDGIYYPLSEDRFAAYRDGIDQIIAKVHDADAKLVLMTPPAFDALPLRKKNKLLPVGAEKYSWKAIYEDYDEVMARYAAWVTDQADRVEMVIDLHTPVSQYVDQKRRDDPEFSMSPDGVHVNEEGHEVLARAILQAWGVEPDLKIDPALMSLVSQRQKTLHDAWLQEVGHKRPGMKGALPIDEAKQQSADLEKQIRARCAALKLRGTESRSEAFPDAGRYVDVHFPASKRKGELSLFVDYFLWIPPGVKKIRGVILHQHGCGVGSSIGGLTATRDLHWQALAEKWDCALMGSSYEARAGESCRLWCDPRAGSGKRFLQALDQFAVETGHAELSEVPWCLWGHSGGGFWSSLMQTSHPDRIAAIWLQSGTAFGYWQNGDVEEPVLRDSVFRVPVMACPGIEEKSHERFRNAWDGLTSMAKAYRRRGAPFGVAVDPRTGHQCGDSRYLAIPFFDACLSQRLPESGSRDRSLRDIDFSQSVLATLDGELYLPGEAKADPKDLLWLPDESFAAKWKEFVGTGAVGDSTPPESPTVVISTGNGGTTVSWRANADFESGVTAFRILKNGKTVATVPEQPVGRFGRPLFQSMSYHDTPEMPWPLMTYRDDEPRGEDTVYQVIAINSVGLESEPASARSTGLE